MLNRAVARRRALEVAVLCESTTPDSQDACAAIAMKIAVTTRANALSWEQSR
jgi:hypothetical protein